MKKITNLEIGTATYFIMRSFFVAICFNSLTHLAKQDSYLSVIIGIIIGLIPLLAFFLIFNYEPSLNIFQKIEKLFGKIIGQIINVILILFTFILAVINFLNLITLIYNQYLNKTPIIFIAIAFIICIYYSLSKGIHNTLKSCIIFFAFSILLYIFSMIGLISKMDINNLKPFATYNFLRGAFSYLSYGILPLYLLLLIPKNTISDNQKTNKTIWIFYIIATISILLMVLSILGIFGIKLSLLYDYPEFQVLKYVKIIGLSARLDSLLFINWIFDILIFIIISLHFCSDGITNIIKIKKNIIKIIFSILLILLTQSISKIPSIDIISVSILPNCIFIITTTFLIISTVAILFKEHKITNSSNN